MVIMHCNVNYRVKSSEFDNGVVKVKWQQDS